MKKFMKGENWTYHKGEYMSEAATVAKKELTETEKQVLLIEGNYPRREGFIRRVCHLWKNYYRINYINKRTGEIPESHFIQVRDGELIVDKTPEK
jgi:hypothetical protein